MGDELQWETSSHARDCSPTSCVSMAQNNVQPVQMTLFGLSIKILREKYEIVMTLYVSVYSELYFISL